MGIFFIYIVDLNANLNLPSLQNPPPLPILLGFFLFAVFFLLLLLFAYVLIFALVTRELSIQLESKYLKIVQNLVNFIDVFPLGLHFLSRVYFPRLCLLITFFSFVLCTFSGAASDPSWNE